MKHFTAIWIKSHPNFTSKQLAPFPGEYPTRVFIEWEDGRTYIGKPSRGIWELIWSAFITLGKVGIKTVIEFDRSGIVYVGAMSRVSYSSKWSYYFYGVTPNRDVVEALSVRRHLFPIDTSKRCNRRIYYTKKIIGSGLLRSFIVAIKTTYLKNLPYKLRPKVRKPLPLPVEIFFPSAIRGTNSVVLGASNNFNPY